MTIKLEYFFVGIAAFGLVFLLGIGILGEGLVIYNVEMDTDSSFGKISSNIKELNEYALDTKDKIEGGQVSEEDAVNEMIAGGYKGIRTSPFRSLAMASNLTQTIVTETPMSGMINPIIIQFALFILTVFITFSIIYLIFRFRSGG